MTHVHLYNLSVFAAMLTFALNFNCADMNCLINILTYTRYHCRTRCLCWCFPFRDISSPRPPATTRLASISLNATLGSRPSAVSAVSPHVGCMRRELQLYLQLKSESALSHRTTRLLRARGCMRERPGERCGVSA